MATVSPAGVTGVQALQARISENGTGAISADFILPAGSTLVDIIIEAEALWTAGTSALLDMGDTADPDGYFSAVNLKATDLLAGESISIGSTQVRGGDDGAYLTVGTSTHVNRRYSAAERTITATITTVGTAATAGRTRITVLYVGATPTAISL